MKANGLSTEEIDPKQESESIGTPEDLFLVEKKSNILKSLTKKITNIYETSKERNDSRTNLKTLSSQRSSHHSTQGLK